MAWRIEFTRSAERDLHRCGTVVESRIVRFLKERLARSDDPRALGRTMHGPDFGDFLRFRVGDYRIIAQVEDETVTILVVKIGHRREVCRK